ncbi:MAG: DUF262 domain-containing protein [Ignavibacteria bacterium]|nr:DUF262 domain-containing protein [Ignavibacteria bacterium]
MPAIDPDEDESIVQPFDPAKIRVETKNLTVSLLLQKIINNELDLAPSFQRKSDIWTRKTKSRLIESLLIRLPIPVFYIDSSKDDKWEIIDGLQRLSTLKSFVVDQDLRLSNLEFLSDLEGKTYNELPRNFQRRILESVVLVYFIEKGTSPDITFNIFKRINTSGVNLSTQEVRYALNQGKATELLKELSEIPEFIKATSNSIPSIRMEDREMVTRFLAFSICSYQEYDASEFDQFLDNIMKRINKMSDSEITSLRHKFQYAMEASYRILGKDAFRKKYHSDDYRRPINKALFESWSLSLSTLDSKQLSILESRKEDLMEGFFELMKWSLFELSISKNTGKKYNVHLRFYMIKKLIKIVLNSSQEEIDDRIIKWVEKIKIEINDAKDKIIEDI